MTVAGIIFSNIHDRKIPEITRVRTMASVPFGCRYRLIDFALSNMVNANIHTIYVVTHRNYQSLMNHVGNGKDWGLARRSGGLKLLPPYITAFEPPRGMLYETRLEALKNIQHTIAHMTETYVVLSDCNVVCNVNLHDMIEAHVESGADMTIAVKRSILNGNTSADILHSDAEGKIVDGMSTDRTLADNADISLHMTVMHREYLQQIVSDSIAHGYTSFSRDILSRNMQTMNYRVYRYDDYAACIDSLPDYYRYHMELLHDDQIRNTLFSRRNRPIYTKIHNSVPVYYSSSAKVCHSMIADGCTVEGTVENSVLFRGVHVGKGACVKNCILMQNAVVGRDVTADCVIADKNVVIRDSRILYGCEIQPYYIEKGRMV